MNEELWKFYIEHLQGHPSRCRSEKTFVAETMNERIGKYFIDKNTRVLVIGCSDGREVHLLNELGYESVIGITLGKLNVEAALQDYPDAIVLNQDMHNLSTFPTESFDYVYSDQTFEHSFAPFIFCLELWSVMKPGGLAYIRYPSHGEEQRSQLTDPSVALMSHHHPNMLRSRDTEALFKLTGFKIFDSDLSGQNDIFIVEKLAIDSLLNNGVHSDVTNTLIRRLNLRR